MRTVWLVRSRQLASKMRFWIALVGYNPKERSWAQVVYLGYVVVFFSVWGFAVLALLADQGAWILSLFRELSPTLASTWIMTSVLLVDALLRGFSSSKKSPFIFSDEDAVLICQTPVDRRQVALAWMFGDWILTVMPFLALAVVCEFAIIQLLEPGGVQWSHLPNYWLAGIRVASVVLFLHLAFTSINYAIGALRLRDDRDNPALRLIPVGFALIFLSLAMVSRTALQTLLWPVQLPLRAGFSNAGWVVGFCVAILLAFGGLLALYFSSPRMNLSRAAQESHYRWAYQQVSWLGDTRVSHLMKLHKRLGTGHAPSHLPGWEGVWALIWKEWVTTLRAINLSQVIVWLGVFLACLGMMLPLDWGAQLWAFIIWVLFVGQRMTESLRADLELWVITRQLPFKAGDVVMVKIARPVILATLLSWLAFGVSAWAGQIPQTILVGLMPPAILCIALAAIYDVFRRCRGSDLLSGHVPEMGAIGLLFGVILAGIPLVLVPLIASRSTQMWISPVVNVIGFGLSFVTAYGLWKLTAAQYRNIK